MIVFDKQNNSQVVYDEKNRILGDLVQELKLFKGENPIDTDAGVDYLAIMQGTKFVHVEINEVLEKHVQNFKSIEIGEMSIDENEVLTIPLQITFKDDEYYETSIIVDKNNL